MASAPTQSGREWHLRTIPTLLGRTYRERVKNILLGLGMALVLALGGVGVANLAAGADHSGTGRQHAPDHAEHGKPSEPGVSGSEHSKRMRDLAQTHHDGMRAWQQCHQAGRANCQKPAPPGWLKHPEKHPGGWPPQHHGSEKNDEAHGDDGSDGAGGN